MYPSSTHARFVADAQAHFDAEVQGLHQRIDELATLDDAALFAVSYVVFLACEAARQKQGGR